MKHSECYLSVKCLKMYIPSVKLALYSNSVLNSKNEILFRVSGWSWRQNYLLLLLQRTLGEPNFSHYHLYIWAYGHWYFQKHNLQLKRRSSSVLAKVLFIFLHTIIRLLSWHINLCINNHVRECIFPFVLQITELWTFWTQFVKIFLYLYAMLYSIKWTWKHFP